MKALQRSSDPCARLQQSKRLICRFLELTDPSLLHIGDNLEVPITKWDTLYTTQRNNFSSHCTEIITPSITVRSHPSPGKNLFSVQSILPNIDARQFWALMANSHNRCLWDSTIELTSVHSWLAEGIDKMGISKEDEDTARKLSARIELLQFGSIMFVANKRDVVLLCVDTQLPSKDGRLRLLSASTSIEVPSLPPKKGYNRFNLNIGGFLVEDLGVGNSAKGIRVTQVSDLGEMASWVPASIIKMVASTMVPKSLNVISKVAFKMNIPKALNHTGAGYGGEHDEEDVERNLCESGGGSWQAQRYLSPILSADDLLLDSANSLDEDVINRKGEELQSFAGAQIENLIEEGGGVALPIPKDVCQEDDVLTIDLFKVDRDDLDASPVEDLKVLDASSCDDTGNDSLASLFCAEESKDCTQMLSNHSSTIKRMSLAQRETQRRISVMLVNGSDSLAMAIAPGARESMTAVARIMNLSIDILEPSTAEMIRTRLGSPDPIPAPPSMAAVHVERHFSAFGSTCSSRSSTTLCEERHHTSPIAASSGSSFTEMPYTIAMGIVNLASWIATRPLASSSSSPLSHIISTEDSEQIAVDDGLAAETSRSTLSALGVTRRAYLQRDAVRIIRPHSHYRIDDPKLNPFPLINDENLPPIGIAAGHPTAIMHCDQAKEASLFQYDNPRQGWVNSYF